MSEQNVAVIRRLMDEVWNRKQFDVVDELFAPLAPVFESGAALPPGPGGVKEVIRAFCAAFPDIRVDIDELIDAGDKVALRWRSVGTHLGELQGVPATNRKVTANGMAIYRFAEGKIVEEWMNTDTLGVLRQLGVTS